MLPKPIPVINEPFRSKSFVAVLEISEPGWDVRAKDLIYKSVLNSSIEIVAMCLQL